MKRIFALILIFLMLCPFIVACGDEEGIVKGVESSEGLKFDLNDDEKSYTLAGIGTCTAENIVVDYYNGYPVTEIARNAMSRVESIKSLTIGDSVTFIGEMSFYGCENLVEVKIGEKVDTIGKNAFEKCISLKEIVIPKGIKIVPMRAFSGCTSLESVIMSEDVEEIKSGAFENCASLCTITIPKNMRYVRDNAFLGCNNLVEVINHSSIEFTKGSEKNGRIAYYALNIHNGESKIIYKDDFMFYSVGDTNYLFKYSGDKTEVTLPDSFEDEPYIIAPYAFCNNTKISSITFGKKVAGIGKNAFEGAVSLKNVELPSDVAAIGAEAFLGCTALESIVIPDSVIGMGINTFKNCSALKSVTIGKGLESVREGTFSGCTALESLIIPEKFNMIGLNAFAGCNSLSAVDFKAKEGWKAGNTSISAEDLSDLQKAAKYLVTDYIDKEWIKA